MVVRFCVLFAVSALSASFALYDPRTKVQDLKTQLHAERLDREQLEMNIKYQQYLDPLRDADWQRSSIRVSDSRSRRSKHVWRPTTP